MSKKWPYYYHDGIKVLHRGDGNNTIEFHFPNGHTLSLALWEEHDGWVGQSAMIDRDENKDKLYEFHPDVGLEELMDLIKKVQSMPENPRKKEEKPHYDEGCGYCAFVE